VSDVLVHTIAAMGTVVTIQVVGHGEDEAERATRFDAVSRAAAWFENIERTCSRFDPASELRALTTRVGEAVEVSPVLFEALRFALTVAESTGGAFDPTVGQRMEALGFDRHHRTGESSPSGIAGSERVTWQDIRLDDEARTVTLTRPLVLDLGAVAKGLAVDVAARELEPMRDFAVDAGGDLYLGGHNVEGQPWAVGIRHPREPELIETLHVTNTAVCTSGDYEKRSPVDADAHHIVDARSGATADALASVTVIAPSALVADALATAAFALGPTDGRAFLESQGVRGLLYTTTLQRIETGGAA
jgi:thiamine biosynthesis lipoprotein